jgi:hypothetical protein
VNAAEGGAGVGRGVASCDGSAGRGGVAASSAGGGGDDDDDSSAINGSVSSDMSMPPSVGRRR